MRSGHLLLLIDSIINLVLGSVLLGYSNSIADFLGLPITESHFYPNILGAVLFGIGIGLLIEWRRKGTFVGIGLGGAIAINIMGGLVLLLWLLFGDLNIPLRGKVILWALDFILLAISTFELLSYRSLKK